MFAWPCVSWAPLFVVVWKVNPLPPLVKIQRLCWAGIPLFQNTACGATCDGMLGYPQSGRGTHCWCQRHTRKAVVMLGLAKERGAPKTEVAQGRCIAGSDPAAFYRQSFAGRDALPIWLSLQGKGTCRHHPLPPPARLLPSGAHRLQCFNA